MYGTATQNRTTARLLEPCGFKIERIVGIGTPAVFHADRILRAIRSRIGDWLALPLFPFALPRVVAK